MTNFNSKLKTQFDSISLKGPNQPMHLTHLYCDYVELLALFSNESYITKGDVLDRLHDEGIISIKESEESYDEVFSDVSEQQDKHEQSIDKIFSILKERETLYGNDYPFILNKNGLLLKSKLDFKNEFYLMLLIASNLNIFTHVQSVLTSEFETVSYYALRKYLPEHSIVKSFGENSDYLGNAKSKIRDLANDLNIEINEKELSRIPESNNKERGLDVIGWIPFQDKTPNFIAVLGQCACGKEWFKKLQETRRFEKYLQFYNLSPIHSLFIPYSIIELGNGFYQSDEISIANLIFERKRIMEFFSEEDIYNNLKSKKIVDMAISFQEDLV